MSDYGNIRIQIFTPEGNFLRIIGHDTGSCFGIAMDTNGMVYASDVSNGHVAVLTPEGQFVTSFGSLAVSLAVDNNGVVYVCSKKKITVF